MKKYIGFKRKLQKFPIKYTITEILVFFLKFKPSAMKKLKIIIGNIIMIDDQIKTNILVLKILIINK